MPIPSDPTREDIILNGMREGGQYTVTASSAAYTDFLAAQWETLKTEIWNACRTDRMLELDTCLVAPLGQSNLTLPSDFDSEVCLYLYDADDTYRGTAQAGGASSLTLASSFTEDPTNMYGRYLFLIGGLGSGQVRQIINYNNTTKVTTVDSAWTTTPDSTTAYLVGLVRSKLKRLDYFRPENPNRRPQFYMRIGVNLLVFPAGDKIYPILMTYRTNLTRLNDTTSTVFIKHLRERRNLWVEGVKTKTMARYDDDRYGQQKTIWERLLAQYGAQNVVYDRMEPNR